MSAFVVTQAPCGHCPFRKDKPIYLRRGRRIEIAEMLLNGGTLPCHATVERFEDEDGDEDFDTFNSIPCAGAFKSLLGIGVENQMMRVSERLGMLDLDRVAERGVEVWDLHTWQDLAEGATADDPARDDEEVETCCTVNEDCLAPAGYAIGGGVTYGTEAADGRCTMCDEALCSNCADSEGRCGMCSEEDQ